MGVFYTITRKAVVLDDRPLGTRGGEGTVYKIIRPLALVNYCVKIYHDGNQTQEKESKIGFMVANQPPQQSSSTFQLCWPLEQIFNANKKFVGFIMPVAFPNSVQLYELVTHKIKQDLPSVWQAKYNRGTQLGVENRVKLCTNLAIAIHTLHKTGRYVLVDFKPQNILITEDGKVSVIDLDSIQVASNGRVVYAARVATPEYTPKEGERLNPANDFIPETWDRFSLAVTFYELLFGIHPYTSTASGQYIDASTIDEKIRKNLFVHGSKKNYLSTIPPTHDKYDMLPPLVKQLFMLAFEVGSQTPTKRPTAEQWGTLLYQDIRQINLIATTKTVNSKSNLAPVVKSPVITTPPRPISIQTLQPSVPAKQVNRPVISKKEPNAEGWLKAFVLIGIVLFLTYIGTRPPTQTADPTPITTDSASIINYAPTDQISNKDTSIDSTVTMVTDSTSTMSADSAITVSDELKNSDPIKYYSMLIASDSTNAEYYNARGDILYDKKEYSEALEDFLKAFNLNENEPLYIANAGYAATAIDFPKTAIECFDAALRIKQDSDWLYMRGSAKVAVMKFEEAIVDFDKALYISPETSKIYYSCKGSALYEMGKINEACTSWNMAVGLGDKDAMQMLKRYCQ